MNAGIPCGCKERERAKDYDPGSENAREHDSVGRDWQQQWRCPRAGFTPAAKTEQLTTACQDSVRAVGRLSGFATACTCPMSYVDEAWVVRAAQAQFYRDKGQLAVVEPMPLSAPMMAALRVLDEQRGERMRRDFERARKQQAEFDRELEERLKSR